MDCNWTPGSRQKARAIFTKHPNSAIERLCFPRPQGGNEIINLENCHQREVRSLKEYFRNKVPLLYSLLAVRLGVLKWSDTYLDELGRMTRRTLIKFQISLPWKDYTYLVLKARLIICKQGKNILVNGKESHSRKIRKTLCIKSDLCVLQNSVCCPSQLIGCMKL